MELKFIKDEGEKKHITRTLFFALGKTDDDIKTLKSAFGEYAKEPIRKEMERMDKDLAMPLDDLKKMVEDAGGAYISSFNKISLFDDFLNSDEFKNCGFILETANDYFVLGILFNELVNKVAEFLTKYAHRVVKERVIGDIFDDISDLMND